MRINCDHITYVSNAQLVNLLRTLLRQITFTMPVDF